MPDLTSDRHTEDLRIEGMTCSHCVAAVRAALESVPGAVVQDVEIGHATVDAAPETDRPMLVEAIETAGFDVVDA